MPNQADNPRRSKAAGRRFFFATKPDLARGLRAAEEKMALSFALCQTRDTAEVPLLDALSGHPDLGITTGHDGSTSPRYLVFPRGTGPSPRAIPQRDGGVKYDIEPTAKCAILRCGGLRREMDVLIAGELQRSLHADCERCSAASSGYRATG